MVFSNPVLPPFPKSDWTRLKLYLRSVLGQGSGGGGGGGGAGYGVQRFRFRGLGLGFGGECRGLGHHGLGLGVWFGFKDLVYPKT